MMTPPRPDGKLDRVFDRDTARYALLDLAPWYKTLRQPKAGDMVTAVLADFYAQDDEQDIHEFVRAWLHGQA